ncbi:MAG: tRNA uridine-5-carboxymethylaminomethyl(34) synthesis GTPase MnmE [Acidobacteriota bacterium]
MNKDCIAAIATPVGEGGIAIIRISGPGSIKIAGKVFHPRSGNALENRPTHTLTLGLIQDNGGSTIDEALCSIMYGPHSYTGEDVVEINCHGGRLAASRCLQAVLNAGARLAEPGEYTKRAFLNGRLDISQAESVIEIIRARSDKALELSLRNLQGYLSKQVAEIVEMMSLANSRIEASIDFPEEVGEPPWEELQANLIAAAAVLRKMLAGSQRTRVYREGIKVVIVGKPNVGKSTLLNALLGKERAIVTDIPGTTRDVIEDIINIRGIPIRLMDTAGLRETGDVVEKIGVEKTHEAIAEAELVIFMLDATTGITEADLKILDIIRSKKKIVLINKEDIEHKAVDEADVKRSLPGYLVIKGSAKYDEGLVELEDAIEEIAKEGTDALTEEVMVNHRQEQALNKALNHMEDALTLVVRRSDMDCLAVDTWGAVSCLEEITGKRIKEDIIERIFSDFCIGK